MPGLKYVDHGGEQVYPQPFVSPGLFYGFVLDAEVESLQRNICDRYFNTPANDRMRFRPAASKVLLTFGNLQGLRSTIPPYSGYGAYPEQEAVFWVLAVDQLRSRLYWTIPYVWVDNAFALLIGREVYGFPKGLGWFQIPADPQRADTFTVETMVLKGYAAQTEATREQLLQVRRVSEPRTETTGGAWLSPEQGARDLLALLVRQDSLLRATVAAADAAGTLPHSTIPMLFLKQFRDAANGRYACYQSIVEAPWRVLRVTSAGPLLGEYAVSVKRFRSHPIHEDLGLKEGNLRPVLSFWVEGITEVGAGREIWRARTPAAVSAPPFV